MTDEVKPSTLARRKYRAANKELLAERRRANSQAEKAWAEARRCNPQTWGKHILPHIKHRALERGLDFDLEASDLLVPKLCPVLGIELKFQKGLNTRANSNTPSVDRFDNNMGYVKSNVRVISQRANQLKSNATVEELRLVLAYMEGKK